MFISSNAEKILKTLHQVAVTCWVGGCASMIALLYASQFAQSDGELFGIIKGYRFVSIIICVYLGAYGSLFTGLAYSLSTNRGFVRHKWVILKWLITIGMIIFGGNFHGKWSSALLELSFVHGIDGMKMPEYSWLFSNMMTSLFCLMFLFVLAILLSVYKPWENSERLALLGFQRQD